MPKKMLILTALLSVAVSPAGAEPPQVGTKAPDFSLRSLRGMTIQLGKEYAVKPVVLIALRGFPGYQCPVCTKQVHDFVKAAPQFDEWGATVLMVYPGGPADLADHAKEFAADKELPHNFHLLLDPGYEFTNLYGLRWDAPKETAYPSTFLIDTKGSIFFRKISATHGDRTTAAEVLNLLKKEHPSR